MLNRYRHVCLTILLALCIAGSAPYLSCAEEPAPAAASPPIKVGMLGMDNYQCVAFMQLWHQQDVPENLAGLRVVAAYPGKPSPKIEKSADNLTKWVDRAVASDVKIVASP